jgi:hypothetical protein
MAAATQQAIKDNRENAVNVRKNRAYQQIKRDMEHRMRQRAKVRSPPPRSTCRCGRLYFNFVT